MNKYKEEIVKKKLSYLERSRISNPILQIFWWKYSKYSIRYFVPWLCAVFQNCTTASWEFLLPDEKTVSDIIQLGSQVFWSWDWAKNAMFLDKSSTISLQMIKIWFHPTKMIPFFKPRKNGFFFSFLTKIFPKKYDLKKTS